MPVKFIVTDVLKNLFRESRIFKYVIALAIFIPLIGIYTEYKSSVQDSLDKNFRSLVEDLFSEEREARLSGATNLGTFIRRGGDYYDESVNILINAITVEQDISVLNAIRYSLNEIKPEDYQKAIHKLLVMERDLFIYEYPLIRLYEDSQGKSEKQELLEKELDRLKDQRILLSNFVALFLQQTGDKSVDGLVFLINHLENLRLLDINLKNSKIEKSTLSSSYIGNTDFSFSSINDTFFSHSDIENCLFSGSTITATLFNDILSFKGTRFHNTEFRDVYFINSDLSGVDFTEAKGLKPIYFYGAYNTDKALFNREFMEELENFSISKTDFLDYLMNSTLTEQKTRYLWDLYGDFNY